MKRVSSEVFPRKTTSRQQTCVFVGKSLYETCFNWVFPQRKATCGKDSTNAPSLNADETRFIQMFARETVCRQQMCIFAAKQSEKTKKTCFIWFFPTENPQVANKRAPSKGKTRILLGQNSDWTCLINVYPRKATCRQQTCKCAGKTQTIHAVTRFICFFYQGRRFRHRTYFSDRTYKEDNSDETHVILGQSQDSPDLRCPCSTTEGQKRSRQFFIESSVNWAQFFSFLHRRLVRVASWAKDPDVFTVEKSGEHRFLLREKTTCHQQM